MSIFICRMAGARGRKIEVFDNKCIITTEVTLGSILTSNAMDGEKTIFYKDVVGIQFKPSKMAIGYMQLETPSMQMNNQSSNMFSENTFTFEENASNMINQIVRALQCYITSRVEGYKYGMDENMQKQNLYALFSVIVPAGLEVNPILAEQWRQYLQESYRLQQAQQ